MTISLSLSLSIILRSEMFQTEVVDKIKTRIFLICNIFSRENRAVYEVMWKNKVKPDAPEMTIRGMRCACWITKATNTQSEYVILIGFLRQQWLRERSSMSRVYVHCMSCHMLVYVEQFHN